MPSFSSLLGHTERRISQVVGTNSLGIQLQFDVRSTYVQESGIHVSMSLPSLKACL